MKLATHADCGRLACACATTYKILYSMQKIRLFLVYGHIMLKTPVLVRSLKLSNIEPC